MGNRINDPVIGTPTDSKELSAVPKSNPFTFGLKSANKTGRVVSGTGVVKEVNPEFDSFADRLTGVEGVYAPEENWQIERALGQSKVAQTANALGSSVINIIPEVIKQASHMLDFSGDYETDNAIATAMTEMQNSVKDTMPVYREDPGASMDFGDYAYWMEQGGNLVTSAAAFAALGYITGGVGGLALKSAGVAGEAIAATRAAKGAIKAIDMGIAATKAEKAISMVEPIKNLVTKTLTGRNINGVSNAVLMNKAEGVGVAIDTYKSTYEKRVQEIKASNTNGELNDAMIDTMAKKDAAEAASYAYNFNKINVLLNLSSSFAFVKPGVAGARQELTKRGMGHAIKNTALEAGQEYLEETINFIAQKRAEAGDAKLDWKDKLKSALVAGSEDAMSTEGIEAGLWGAIGGATQTGFTKAGSFIKMHHNDIYDDVYKKNYALEQEKAYKSEYNKNYESNYEKHLAAVTEKNDSLEYDQQLPSDALETMAERYAQQETHKIALTEAGRIAELEAGSSATAIAGDKNDRISSDDIIKYKNSVLETERAKLDALFDVKDSDGQAKVMEAYGKIDLFNDTAGILEIDDLYQQAVNDNDEDAIERLGELKFDTRIVQAMKAGTLNTLEDHMKSIASLTPAQAVEAGIASDEQDVAYKAQAQKGLKSIKDIEKIAYRNRSLVNNDSVTGLDINIYRASEKIEKLQKEFQPLFDATLAKKRHNLQGEITSGVYESLMPNYTYLSAAGKTETYNALTDEQRKNLKRSIERHTAEVQLNEDDFNGNEDGKEMFNRFVDLKKSVQRAVGKRMAISSKSYQALLKEAQKAAIRQAADEDMARKIKQKQDLANAKEKAKRISVSAKKAVTDVKLPTTAEPEAEERTIDENGNLLSITTQEKIDYIIDIEARREADINSLPVIDFDYDKNVPEIVEIYGNREAELADINDIYDQWLAELHKIPVVDKSPASGKTTSVAINDDGDIEIETGDDFSTAEGTTTAIDQTLLAFTKEVAKLKIDSDGALVKARDILIGNLTAVKATLEGTKQISSDKLRKAAGGTRDLATMISISDKRRAAAAFIPYIEKAVAIIESAAVLIDNASALAESVQAQAANDAEVIGTSDTSFNTDDDILGEDEEEEEGVIDLGKEVAKVVSFKNASNAFMNFTNLMDSIKELGYPVNNFDDVESFLYKVMDRESIVKLRPQFIKTWNALMTLNDTPQMMVDPGSYKTTATITQEEFATKMSKDLFWSDEKEAEVDKAIGELVDSVNNITEVLPTREYSQGMDKAQFKSVSALNLAYLAKGYTYVKNVANGFINKIKTDLEGLNDVLDRDVLDPDHFKIGSEVVLSPLRPNATHTYIENGKYVEVQRLKSDPSKVEFRYYTIDTSGKKGGIIEAETNTKPVETHLPIFIKRKNGKKYEGMYLHIADWVNEVNVAGTASEVLKQRQLLIALRDKAINNKAKNLVVKVTALSDGVYLTDGIAKPVSAVSETNVPDIAILNRNFELRSSRDSLHQIDNNINLRNFNVGATFMIVDNGKQKFAIPVKKKPFSQLKDGEDIASTIVKLIDLYMTPLSERTEPQNDTDAVFKNELNINTSNPKEVMSFVKKFLYTEFYKAKDTKGFMEYMNILKDSKEGIGTSVFNMNITEDGKPFLQFGRIGDGNHLTIDSKTLRADRDLLLKSLKNTILDAYLNTNSMYLNQTREIKVLKENNEVSFIGKSYKDFLRDNTFTTIKPTTIQVNNKPKEIYTIQRTIQIGNPNIPVGVAVDQSAVKEDVLVESKVEEEVLGSDDSFFDNFLATADVSFNSEDDLLAEEEEGDVKEVTLAYRGDVVEASLLDKYDFIPNLDSNITQAILEDAYRFITKNLLTSEGGIDINDALDQTFAKIADYLNIADSMRSKLVNEPDKLASYDRILAARREIHDTILANKEKFKAKVQERITQKGVLSKGNGEDVATFKKEVKLKQQAAILEQQRKAIEEGNDISGEMDNTLEQEEGDDNLQLTDEDIELNEDLKEENGWATENIYKNSYKDLDSEVKDFFTGIQDMSYDRKKEPKPSITVLGLPSYVDAMDAYLTVQHILANYPNQTKKEATFENYLRLIKKEAPKRLFLYDVIARLEDKALPESFKIAFVKNMNKQYNNLLMLDVKKNGKSSVVALDRSNALKVSLGSWMATFNNTGRYVITAVDGRTTTKTLDPALVASIKEEYDKVMKFVNTPVDKRSKGQEDLVFFYIKRTYEALGINLHPNFYKALQSGGVMDNSGAYTAYYDVSSLASSSLYKEAIATVIGNPGLGIPANNNLFNVPLFQHYGFNKLAKLNAEFETNLYGNSARDVGGNTVSSFSEQKNIMDSFFRNRDDEDYLLKTFSDPYRDISKQVDNKKVSKTWLESLINVYKGKFGLNRGSLFSNVFEHGMWNGASFQGNKGKDRVAIEKMTDYGLLKLHLNAYLNSAQTQMKDGEEVHIGYLPFFTMSDKKIPSVFKVPLEKFSLQVFSTVALERLKAKAQNGTETDINNLEKVISQREMIFNSLVRPELNRIVALAREGELAKINIEGYERRNLKFYQSSYLNDIDLDYIDGDRTKGLDKTGALRERLGITDKKVNYLMQDPSPDNLGGTIINTAVLEKDTVQQFLLEKMMAHLTARYYAKTEQLVEKGIIYRDDANPKVTYFSNDTGIDEKAVRKLTKQDVDDGIATRADGTILNFVVNSQIGYANMQQLLVTDPIQFAKTGTSTKFLKALNNARAEVTEHKNSVVAKVEAGGEETAIDTDKAIELAEAYKKAAEAYHTAWAYTDGELTYDNQAKRLAADNASGSQIVPVNGKTRFNLLVLKDFETSSDFIEEYKAVFKAAGYSEELAESSADAYSSINTADAQELTTLSEHLDVMIGRALISPADAARLLADDNAGKLKVKDFNQILTAMKLVYGNTFVDEENGINRRLYVKSASFPLSKTFTKGLPIDKLRVFMETNKIERAAFESAVKVGGPKEKASIFSENGDIDTSGIDMTKHVIMGVPREGHKNQTDLPYDEAKQVKRDSTQQSKMQFNDLMDEAGFIHPDTGKEVTGRELHRDYVKVMNEYYREKFFKLRDRIFTNGEIQFDKLHSILLEAAESREYSQNAKSFLDLNEDGTDFEFPLWLSENADKIESLLNSIVDNAVRIRKRRGFSKVLVSDSILDISQASKSNIVLLDKNRTDKLLPMRKDPETGNWLPAEIVVTFPFRDNMGNLLNLSDYVVDGQLDTTKIPEEILEGVGLRIPYQGLNSSSNVKIVGFLPADVDGIAFGPKDWVVQMGSDFDADKLNVDIYNTIYDGNTGSLRKITEADIAKQKGQKQYMKEKRKLDKLQRANEVLNDPSLPLYKKNVKDINISIAKLSDMLNGATQTDFLSDFYDTADMNTKFLENKMTDYSKNILSNGNPKVQAKRLQSIDSASLIELRDEIVPKVFIKVTDKNWTPNDHSFQVEKYMGARGGKTGVSGFSSDAVLNSILQGIRSSVRFLNFDGKNTFPVSFHLYGKQSNALNVSNSIDGGFKSDIIQALQSIAVDNEKLLLMDKLNINDHTSDFIRTAIQVGYSAKDIFYFINHPVIKEYVKAMDNEKKFFEPKNYTEETVDGATSKVYRKKADYVMLEKGFTHKQMLEDIKRGIYQPNNATHDAIFRAFKDMSDRGKQLKQLGTLLNIDSSGIGSNLLFSLNKERAVNDLKGNKSISNINQLLNHSRPNFEDAEGFKKLAASKDNSEADRTIYEEAKKKYEDENKKLGYIKMPGSQGWLRNTSIPGSAIHYALKFNNRMWRKIFPYTNARFEEVRESILALNKNKTTDVFLNDKRNEALLLEVKADNTGYKAKIKNRDKIVSTSPKADSEIETQAIKSYRAFLFSSIAELDGKTASEVRRDLVHSNKLANVIQAIKANNLLPNNRLIGKLIVDTVDEGGPESMATLNVIFDATTGDSFEEDRLLQDMIELIESNETIRLSENGNSYAVKDLARDLVYHQMVTSGVQKANQFIKHIPYYHLKNIGLYKNMQNLVESADSNFLEQFIQHYPELVYSEELNRQLGLAQGFGMFSESNGIITMKGANTYKNLGEVSTGYTDYVSVKNADDGYTLYKRSSFNPDTYLAISTLGMKGMTEYDAAAKTTIKSGFEENVPPYEWGTKSELMKEAYAKGYTPSEIRGKMKDLEEAGKDDTDKTDPNKIYKICE